MKITRFETIPIQGRAMVLKMFTDEGIIGYGEPMNYEHWRVVAQAVADMEEYLVGKDPSTSPSASLHVMLFRSLGRVDRFVFGGISHEMCPQRGHRISSSTRFLTLPVFSGFRRV